MSFYAAQKNATVTSIGPPRNESDPAILDCLDHFNLNSLPLLLPEESYATVFHVSKKIGTAVKIVGTPHIKWCTYMGEHGVVRGNEVVLTSCTMISTYLNEQVQGDEEMIYIDCINSPTKVIRGKEFDIILRITNNTNRNVLLQLICKDIVASSYSSSLDQILTSNEQISNTKKDTNSNMNMNKNASTLLGQGEISRSTHEISGSQLFVTGSSKRNLNEMKNGGYVDLSVRVCSVDFGLQELKGISVIDKNTLKEYTTKSLLKVMVVDHV